VFAVFTDDTDADEALAERGTGCCLTNDVVAEAGREQQPDRVAVDVDAGICVAPSG
jgi:hypothetical protein